MLLGLAVQTKVTAVLLLPLLLVHAARRGARPCLEAAAAFVVSFLPTVVSLAYYPSVGQLVRYSAPIRYNPYYWDLLDPSIFAWNPRWLVGADAAASWTLIAVLVVAAARARDARVAYLAPLAFAALLEGPPERAVLVLARDTDLPAADPAAAAARGAARPAPAGGRLRCGAARARSVRLRDRQLLRTGARRPGAAVGAIAHSAVAVGHRWIRRGRVTRALAFA